MSMEKKLGLVLVPVWGLGHLVALVEAGKRLLQLEGSSFAVTVLSVQPPSVVSNSMLSSYLDSATASCLDITVISIPPVEFQTEPFHGPEDFISRFMEAHKEQVKDAVASLSSSLPVAALVLDFFASSLIDVGHEFGIPSYIYFTSGAFMLALMLHLPTLTDTYPDDILETGSEIVIPGMSPIPAQAIPDPMLKKSARSYYWFVYHGRRFLEATGIIVNTFRELEQGPLDAIANGCCTPGVPAPILYPVGPVLALEEDSATKPGGEKHECLRWLDEQPLASVVLLCFGSMGSFEASQVREIAVGLEQSGHRFLWCLRMQSPGSTLVHAEIPPEDALLEGFQSRTADRGLLWTSWVPQAAILAHPAVGGFVTHCGWNSALESLWHGVPMLGWPLYAEQHLNAFEMVELGVAVELKVDRTRGNFAAAAEVERGVRCLMGEGSEEGKRVRTKVEEMKLACRKAVGDGGSSRDFLEKLAQETTRAFAAAGTANPETNNFISPKRA